tara:strand:+ start:293 stop:508 length:216 start_codon:yes stop_codon:yes gene_type:complete
MYKKHPPLEKTYNKTLLVIESCITKEQLEGASNMVKNFKTSYKKVGYPKALSYSLDRALKKKYFRVTKQYH